jgi:hypothetical protein
MNSTKQTGKFPSFSNFLGIYGEREPACEQKIAFILGKTSYS